MLQEFQREYRPSLSRHGRVRQDDPLLRIHRTDPAGGAHRSNYRAFGDRDINELRFIRRARTLGFSIEDIVILLSLWRDRTRPSREVRAVAEQRLAGLHARIAEMQAMADTLETLARCCAGDERPDCPILADLAAAREN